MTDRDEGAVVLDALTITDPQALLGKLGTTSPVHRVIMPDGMATWLVTGYREARRVLSDSRLARSAKHAAPELQDFLSLYKDQFFPHSMVFNDKPDHTRMKKVVSQAFTPRAMEQMRPRVQGIVDRLIDAIAEKGEADILPDFALPLPNEVICEWFGVPGGDRSEFVQHCGVVTGLAVTSDESDLFKAGDWFNNYLTELIDARRADPSDDMISAIITGEHEFGQLSEIELRSNIFLMLIGSVETAVNMIANGTLALLRNPDAVALLRRDPSQIHNAVEEILRIDAPVLTVSFHFATQDLTIAGVEVKKGEHVAISLNAANYDAAQFPEPERFDISRPGGHLSLSHGIHFCLGAPLARLEGEIAFSTLLRRSKDIELAVPESELTWKPSFYVHRLNELPVRFTPA